jgi:hypothetical protein
MVNLIRSKEQRMQPAILYTALIFLFILLSGLWLRRSGKPYKSVILNIHKFIALGTIAYLVVTVLHANQPAGLDRIEIIAAVLTALSFIGDLATGGLLSIRAQKPETTPSSARTTVLILRLHQVFPFLTVILAFTTLILVINPAG